LGDVLVIDRQTRVQTTSVGAKKMQIVRRKAEMNFIEVHSHGPMLYWCCYLLMDTGMLTREKKLSW
jgi:hypothetical protein